MYHYTNQTHKQFTLPSYNLPIQYLYNLKTLQLASLTQHKQLKENQISLPAIRTYNSTYEQYIYDQDTSLELLISRNSQNLKTTCEL